MKKKEEQVLIKKGTAILKKIAVEKPLQELIAESKERVWQKIVAAQKQ